ncbi:MAG: hypothetical protein J6M64_05755 [Oscillospiraceae bacterium]|nr:hypothetical protein [Clostridia bacterium]MBP3209388.1 hypothetical protein [Oscillospiraceae bacterium]
MKIRIMVGNASCKRKTNKTKRYTTDNNSAELKKQIFSDNIKKEPAIRRSAGRIRR